MTEPAKSSEGKHSLKMAAKWNGFVEEYDKNTKKTKQYKPTLVLSVIGDSNTFVPKQWPKSVFQTALIETAKSEERTWILYRDSTDGVSKVVEEAYDHYDAMEPGTETKAESDQARRIRLISTSDKKGAKKTFEKTEVETSFLAFETFVSKQKIFYFGTHLEFKIPVPTVVIVCEGDVQTIFHISEALTNQLPVIIMKGSGKAADLVLDYLENCGGCVIEKKYNLLFGAKFDEKRCEEMKTYLKCIEQNRKLVWEFDLHMDDPLKLSSIVGEAVISSWSTKNILKCVLENPNKKTKKVESQDESLKQKSTKLSEGLNLERRSYVMNPKFSTSTSLPLYFYLEYQVLQENVEYMKECGKVLLLEALKANRSEYVSSLMNWGVNIDSKDVNKLYRKKSKKEEILIKLSLRKECARRTVSGNSKCEKQEICFVEAVKQECRNILGYEEFTEFHSEEKNSDVSIGDILLWAIIFNRRELAEICWLREKDHLLTGLVCSAILEKLSKEAVYIEEHVLAVELKEHSMIFEQRCTSIMDKMNEEDPCETIRLLTTISSVFGIHSSPLDFAYENMMYDVVAHACSKKYLKMTLYSNLATESRSFLKSSVKHFISFIGAPITRHMCHFLIFIMALMMYSSFVLTSISTEYYNQGPAWFFEYSVYIWRFGDLIEDYLEFRRVEGHSRLHRLTLVYNYINNLWNFWDLLSHFILVLAMFLRHLGQDETQTFARNMFALYLLVLYMRFLEVFLILEWTGTTIIMIIEMIKDLRKFIHIILVVVLGVGIYYHANLWPDDQTMWSGGLTRWRIWTIIYYPYWQIYGEANLETLTGSDQENCTYSRYIWESDPSTKRCPEEDWTVPVIAGLYMIFVNLLLVNIVIANFSNTFEFVHTNSEKLWHYHLYTVIKDYSQRIPSPINLIVRPVKWIIQCLCNQKVDDSSHQSTKNEKEAKKKKYQQILQKIAALRNHKENNSNKNNSNGN